MSNLYFFLYLQPFVKKKMMVITPGLTLYLLCPNFIPLDPLCDQTLHMTTQQSPGTVLLLGLLVWAISLSSFSLLNLPLCGFIN